MLGTLEDLKLKEKWRKAYAEFCKQQPCSPDCIVQQEATKHHIGCMLAFCRMKEANKL